MEDTHAFEWIQGACTRARDLGYKHRPKRMDRVVGMCRRLSAWATHEPHLPYLVALPPREVPASSEHYMRVLDLARD